MPDLYYWSVSEKRGYVKHLIPAPTAYLFDSTSDQRMDLMETAVTLCGKSPPGRDPDGVPVWNSFGDRDRECESAFAIPECPACLKVEGLPVA